MVEQTSKLSKRDIIAEMLEDTYIKSYRMRMVGPGSLETTIPRAIVDREARKRKLPIEEFIKVYQVQYLFNDFDDAFVRFKRPGEDEETLKAQKEIRER